MTEAWTCGLRVVTAMLLAAAVGRGLTVEDVWQYTTDDPGPGWEKPGFDARGWETGRGGFSGNTRRRGPAHTEWRTADIWLRGEHVLGTLDDVQRLSLEIRHDEDFEAYINGVLAARATGHIDRPALFPISDDARQAMGVGPNTVAVHCHQTVGGQFIDLGFTTADAPTWKEGERRGPVERVDIAYAKRGTWQATMLAVRAGLAERGVGIGLAQGCTLAYELWRDFPHETDWLMQDSPGKMSEWTRGRWDGKRDLTNFLRTGRDASLERQLVETVLAELGPGNGGLREELDRLAAEGAGPEDRRWLDLYVKACGLRRLRRLQPLLSQTDKVLFARHHNMGGGFFAYTEYTHWSGNRFGGLCLLHLRSERVADGDFANVEVLVRTDSEGATIRNPALSYDGNRALFAWRRDRGSRYKIHEIELASRVTRQLTDDTTYGADYDPCYLPDGNVLFNSTRVVQSVDCAGPDVSNFFICNRDGKHARRIGFDQVHTMCPSVLDDGRVVYMRWDYNDRSQIYTQPLFEMRPDGTGQTEFYGNNTFSPTTFFHPRGIPGTSKVMCVIGGHHNPQCGKLAIVETSLGRQDVEGVVELPSGQPPTYRKADKYAQTGDQYMYPFPLDENHLLVSYDPIAYNLDDGDIDTKDDMRFHLYFMATDGRRELLAADPRISSCQPIPVMARTRPPVRPSSVDHRVETGTFYLQDVYHGPGLAGVPRGTIKKLRVIALRYREMAIGANGTSGKGGSARVVTPVAIGTGTWDVKVILGDATVHEDGSAMFTVPARTPVYFQALNDKNQMIQTMRSWSTLMPGEVFACAGCHEHKNSAAMPPRTGMAAKRGAETLSPFYGPARGFSFPKEIQPILDRHCIRCHRADGPEKARAAVLTDEPILDNGAKRNWSRAYLALTNAETDKSPDRVRGRASELVNWISNSSEPTMIPPQYGGSTRSKLIDMLEAGHQKVTLSREELDTFCAWIDLVVPFCGDYVEANAWNDRELGRARERIELRRQMDRIERQNNAAFLSANH